MHQTDRTSAPNPADLALRTLARLLGRQAARETFAHTRSPDVQDPASEPPAAPSASHQERTDP